MSWINASTKIFGVLGKNIGYTLSPAIHNYIFREVNYNAVYLVFDVDEEKFGDVAKALLHICEGLNVTIPYKESIMPYLASLDTSAEKVGAVNTVHRGKGYNTDYMAIKSLARNRLGVQGNGVCYIFGAGGAAKAASVALGELGFAVRIVNRSTERALKVVKELRSYIDIDVSEASKCSEADVVVNATPNPDFVPDTCIHEDLKLVVELVYKPVETSLVRRARGKGVPVINGLEILVAQALEAQRIWLGIDFPFEKVVGYLYARELVR